MDPNYTLLNLYYSFLGLFKRRKYRIYYKKRNVQKTKIVRAKNSDSAIRKIKRRKRLYTNDILGYAVYNPKTKIWAEIRFPL